MATCAADHCYNTNKKGTTMFRFPTDVALRERWVTMMQRNQWTPNESNRLCQDHFDANQWIKYAIKIKPDAVPSRFCTCGFTISTSKKKKPHIKAKDDHSYFLIDSATPIDHDHGYFKRRVITPEAEPTTQSWTRKMCCPLDCPCRHSHLGTCAMAQKVRTPLQSVPLSKVPIFTVNQKPTSKLAVTSVPPLVPQTLNVGVTLPEKASALDPLIEKIMKENDILREKIKMLSRKENSPVKMSDDSVKDKKYALNRDQEAAIKWGTTRGRVWSTETVRKGLQLKFSCQTSGYKQVIKNVAPFPAVRTLQRKTQHLKFQPGILSEVLDAFEVELKNYSELDKDCGLFFDEMAINSSVEMDRSTGLYIGHPTLPGVKGVANKALVFMFGGLHKKWKISVAYHFVPKDGHPESVCQVIIELLKQDKSMGLHIRVLVCDMGMRNVLKALGFSTKKDKIIYKIPNPADPIVYCYIVCQT